MQELTKWKPHTRAAVSPVIAILKVLLQCPVGLREPWESATRRQVSALANPASPDCAATDVVMASMASTPARSMSHNNLSTVLICKFLVISLSWRLIK